MKTLKLSENKAIELYNKGTNELKEILEESFGKDFFNKKITDKVKDLDSLCEYLDIELEDLYIFKDPKTKFEKYINSCAIIPKIVEIYNEGKILNWNNSNEYKYLPYLKVGSGVLDDCYCWVCSAGGPVSHYYKSSELCLIAIKNFKQIYLDYLSYKG